MRTRKYAVALMVALLAFSSHASAQPREPLFQSFDMQVPVAPRVTTIAGTRILVHELHLTNLTSADFVVRRIALLGMGNDTVSAFDSTALESMMARPGMALAAGGEERRSVRPGSRAVVYFWTPLAAGSAPSAIRHVAAYDEVRNSVRTKRQVMSDAFTVATERTIMIDAPLRGGPWVAIYDPSMMGGHRTALYTFGGRARIPGRFAVDFMKLDSTGATTRSGGRLISDAFGYGEEVLAVADGVVADARDDTVEDSLISVASARRYPPAEASGNHVVLDVGDGRFVFYEHLKRGSIRIKSGDRVRRGQVIGQLGNSGSSSSGPHLHFHVANDQATLKAEGMPFVFRSFEVLGGYPTIMSVGTGSRWSVLTPTMSGARRGEAPAANVVIRWDNQR